MDLASIALRLLVYLQGGLLLAMLLFAQPWTAKARRAAAGIAMAGIGLCLASLALLTAAFAENGSPFDAATFQMLAMETAAGWAAIARIAALIVVMVTTLASSHRLIASIFGVIAVGTLACSGHGAMTEDAMGWVHLGGDALHLVAGLGWIGAVAAFLWAACRSSEAAPDLQIRLERFATTGTIFVALLLITGIANTLFIVGWDGLAGLAAITYGKLLLLKVTLFAVMLTIAATNRFWLTPRLAASRSSNALSFSLGTELLLGMVVVLLVALLGMLDPSPMAQ
jgi:copper resistance protein D